MLFEFKNHQFTSAADQEKFAKTLSHIIEPNSAFVPHKHPWSGLWILDSAGAWRVGFYESNPDRFSVSCTHQNTEDHPEERLAEWIEFRLKCKAIE